MDKYRRGYYPAAIGRIWAHQMKRPYIHKDDNADLYNFVAGILNTKDSGTIHKVINMLDIDSVADTSIEHCIARCDPNNEKEYSPTIDKKELRREVADD